MITDKQMKSLMEIRQTLFDAIKAALDNNIRNRGYNTGKFECGVTFPNYFEAEKGEGPEYYINMHCYLPGLESRTEYYFGKSFQDALDKLKVDIERMLEEHNTYMKAKSAEEKEKV
jgi:hypothetical protein